MLIKAFLIFWFFHIFRFIELIADLDLITSKFSLNNIADFHNL
jgi:hypothetical protein